MTASLSWRLRPLRALNHISVLSIVFGLLLSYAGATSSLSDDVNLTLNPRLGLGRVQGRRSIHTRAVQSAATCLSQFDWMDNSLGQSPCLTVAYLLSACSSGNWNVPSLPDADHHYSVTVENANGCQCSWAAYNTYQACSLCQGNDFGSAMRTWSGYNLNCTGHLSDPDYYPPDTPIPAETAIPFWATTDPSTWHNGKFDPTTAQSIKNEGHSDITETSRSEAQTNKSSNTGAIVGGVVGGVLGLAALALIFFFLRRRHRYTRLQQQQQQQNQGANLKHRPTFSTVRFSPSLLTHWRTGSSGTTATAATLAGQPMGGKVAGQTAASYMYGSGAGGGILTTPSPGPTIPVSMTGSTGGGRPPLNSNSSSSYTSGHTMTNTPPLGGRQEYVTRPAGKNYAYGIPQPIPAGQGGGGYLTAMNLSHSNSNSNLATIAPSSASTTAGGASAIARNSHAHTLSNDSVGFSVGSQYGGEPPEGTVVPFILPPTLPEPMGGESGAGAGGGAGPGAPSASSKGAHGRGPSDSSNVTSNAPAPVRASTPDLFTTAFNPARPPPERRNPPAYTPTSPPPPAGILPIPPGIDGNTSLEEYRGTDTGRGADGDGDGDALSVEAQRAETTLSGTTLRGQGTYSGRAPTTLGDDAVHNRPGGEWGGVRGERGEGIREERDRFGYPADRKV